MKINKYLLSGDNVSFVETPNTSGKFKPENLDSIIIHYTAGSSLESSVNSLTNKSVKASAHIVIGRDGKIIQLAPFNIITWHAGKSSHNGRNGMNHFSIGIELDNAGSLDKVGDAYVSWFKKSYSKEEAFYGIHRNETKARYWHNYTEAQIKACYELCELLKAEYKIKYILGHEEISPGRKTDPGPAFPLDDFRNKILDNDRSINAAPEFPTEGRVATSKLNIRKGPGVENEKFPEQLSSGETVRILEEKDGWYKIEVKTTGWVSKDYIK